MEDLSFSYQKNKGAEIPVIRLQPPHFKKVNSSTLSDHSWEGKDSIKKIEGVLIRDGNINNMEGQGSAQ